MRYHSVVGLLLCLTVAQTYSMGLMIGLSKTSMAEKGLEKHLPACFNSDSVYQIRKGKLFITDEPPHMQNTDRNVRDASGSSSGSSERERHTERFTAADLYPSAGRAAIDSLYVTNTSLAAVGISAAAAVCVLDSDNKLMNCVSGQSGSGFGASVCIDESNKLLIIAAPKSISFFVSQWRSDQWAQPLQFILSGVKADDELGTGLACVQNVCAFGAPGAQDGAGEIHIMKQEASGSKWMKLCKLPAISGIERLGEILRSAVFDAYDDMLLLQASGRPEGSDVLLPILYKLKLDGSNCDSVLPDIDFSMSDGYVCSIEDRGSICIDKLGPSHSSSSSNSE